MKELITTGVIRRKDRELAAPKDLNLLKRPAWKPPEILVREGGLEYKNWKSKGGD